MKNTWWRRLLVRTVLVVPVLLVSAAPADVLVLHDGQVLRGEVRQQDRLRIVFRARVDGAWTDLEIDTDEIRDLFVEPGNQADVPTTPPRRPEPPGSGPPDAPVGPPGADGDPIVAIIPLHGQVGGLVDGSVEGTFDVEVLRRCLRKARNAEIVVLDIDSPGGFLVEMEAICQLIVEQQNDQRIVAYCGDALSAAAIIALTCREIVVRPDARVGAAVMVTRAPEGLNAVEAKLASPYHARQRQFMKSAGRPYDLLASMTIQEARLWHSPTAGLTGQRSVAEAGDDFRQVDGPATVLTMTAEEATSWGVASGAALGTTGIAPLLGLDGPVQLVDLGNEVSRYNRETDRRLAVVLEQFGSYFQALGRLHGQLKTLPEAISTLDDEASLAVRSSSRRLARRARDAARIIERQDHELLAARVNIPDSLIAQLHRDTRELQRVADLAREGDVTSASQAVAAVEAMLDGWKELIERATERQSD